jgi:hypothetical protein
MMQKIAFKCLVGLAASAVAGIALAQSVADPVAELVRAGGVNKDDSVVVVNFDWNEDGKDDILVTTNANISTGGRDGGDWNVWLSNASGTYDLAGSVLSPGGAMSVVRLSEVGNAKAIAVYSPAGGGYTGITAYYLGSGQKVETKDIGTIGTSDITRTPEHDALEQRVFGSAVKVEPKIIPAAQLWPKEVPATTPPPVPQASKSETIEVVDPLDQSRWIILRSSDNEVVGYRLGEKRISIDEAAQLGLPVKRDVRAEREQIAARAEQDRLAKSQMNRLLLIAGGVALLIVFVLVLRRFKSSKEQK